MFTKSRTIRISALLLSLILILSGCGLRRDKRRNTLNIGTDGITGNFNPFYAESEGDLKVINQVFRSIQRTGKDNRLINSVGSISYEPSDSGKIKYTVSIRNNLHFSNGSNVTIDDVIFFYYFIADATYTGVYSGFYQNDIVGLKEYYYDSENYEAEIEKFKGKKNEEALIKRYIERNYQDGTDISSISGIKRVDDYTCTILYDSGNINSISEINAVIVSKAFYAADYIKGKADTVKSISSSAMGCGPYAVTDYKPESHTTTLNSNPYYETAPSFSEVVFRDLSGSDNSKKIKSVLNGNIDIVSVSAEVNTTQSLNSPDIKYYLSNTPGYISAFINTRVVTDATDRGQLFTICNNIGFLTSEYGSYCTRLARPLSIRFPEYPSNAEPYFTGAAIAEIVKLTVKSLDVYYIESEDGIEKRIAECFADNLNAVGITSKTVKTEREKLMQEAESGKAVLWIMKIDEPATCDKFDYYNSEGKYNYTGISDFNIDSLTGQIRTSIGYTDKKATTENLLTYVMNQAIEMPVCQMQTVTVYNLSAISPESVSDLSEYDGYDYVVPLLY